jgi:hypothetical protein
LAAVVVGFVLTVLIGAIVTYFSNYLQSEREHKLARVAERQPAVQKMADAFNVWSGNASLMKWALAADLPLSQLSDLKKSYDESLVQFHVFAFERNLTFEKVLPIGADNDWAQKFAEKYGELFVERIEPLEVATHNCIMGMYSYVALGKRIPDEMFSCEFRRLREDDIEGLPSGLNNRIDAFDLCASSYVELLYLISRVDPDDAFWSEKEKVVKLERFFADSLDRNCKVRYRVKAAGLGSGSGPAQR